MSKIDDILEKIGNAISEANLRIENEPDVHNYLDMAREAYIPVTWPDVQDLMEEEWFDEEAILDVDNKFGPSAYLVPLKYLL